MVIWLYGYMANNEAMKPYNHITAMLHSKL